VKFATIITIALYRIPLASLGSAAQTAAVVVAAATAQLRQPFSLGCLKGKRVIIISKSSIAQNFYQLDSSSPVH